MLSGCTTSCDHLYVHPRGTSGLIDAEIRAASDAGIRFHATRGSMSLSEKDGGLPPDDVVQEEDEVLADSERVVAAFHDQSAGAMTRVGLAPCSPFSVTPELMRDPQGNPQEIIIPKGKYAAVNYAIEPDASNASVRRESVQHRDAHFESEHRVPTSVPRRA